MNRDLSNSNVSLNFLYITDSNPVYFSAYLTATFTPPRDQHTNVVYNGLHFDSHKAYNPSTGYFTAPVSGLYVFSWENLTAPGKVFDTELLVNGIRHELDNCNNEGSTAGYLSCTQVVPVKLNAGDLVNIRTTYGNYAHGGWSSFSGWLVHWSQMKIKKKFIIYIICTSRQTTTCFIFNFSKYSVLCQM